MGQPMLCPMPGRLLVLGLGGVGSGLAEPPLGGRTVINAALLMQSRMVSGEY